MEKTETKVCTKCGVEKLMLANLAGKMIASAKVQVEYFALRKESPDIAFLNSPAAAPQSPTA